MEILKIKNKYNGIEKVGKQNVWFLSMFVKD